MVDEIQHPVQFPIHLPPWLACPNCSQVFTISDEITEGYFRGENSSCPSCNRPFDWWDTLLRHIREGTFFLNALTPVGARSSLFKITLRQNHFTELKLSDYGIPTDAKILNIAYTPEGSLFPAEFYGNVPQRHIVPHVVRLYPVPLEEGPHTDTEVNVMVTWVPHTGSDYAWQNLVDAFEAYESGR